MQQIDSADGLFHDGNPATGELGTIVTASWLNSVQEELANLMTGLGGTLNTGKHDQLKTLLSAALDSKAAKAITLAGYGIGDAAPKHNAALTGTPTAPTAPAGTATTQLATTGFVTDALANNAGLPLLFPLWCPNRAAIPAGYAPADGQTLARSLYPDAWAGIAAGNVPTVADATWLSTPTERGKFTAGDGSTTFRLPDYNGKAAGSLGAVFMRGDGVLSAGTAGTIQGDAIQNITGQLGMGADIGLSASPNPTLAGPFYVGAKVGSRSQGTNTTDAYLINFDASRAVRTAPETRPMNVTGCWAIRLFGAVTNPGAADAAQLATEVAKLQAQKLDAAAALGTGYMLVEHQTAPGVEGGNVVAGIQRRPLNTVVVNTIVGASLNADQITLPAGTYRLRATATAFHCNGSKIALYNVTDAAYIAQGISLNGESALSDYMSWQQSLNTRFTLATTKVIELRQFAELAATYGLGKSVNAMGNEVYASVEINKE